MPEAMRPRRRHVSAAVLALFASAALVFAPVALAVFTHAAAGGPQTVATSTLAAPKGVAAAQVNCRLDKSPEVEVKWSATSSTYATSYEVERATSSAGSYTELASVAYGKTSYTDKSTSLASSTTYYYRVTAEYQSWSATSVAASVKTLSKSCF
jgi:hypothetical protein